jgi:hypothetical protein
MRTITLSMIDRNAYAEDANDAPIETTVPVDINVEMIRCYYTRKAARPGTRITFSDGHGFAVSEPFEHVRALVTGAPLPVPAVAASEAAPDPINTLTGPAAALVAEAAAAPEATAAPEAPANGSRRRRS